MSDIVNMSDQFKGLPMADLIGAPLHAACDAQVMLARATADFIKVIGFLPPTDPADPNGNGGTRNKAEGGIVRRVAFGASDFSPFMAFSVGISRVTGARSP